MMLAFWILGAALPTHALSQWQTLNIVKGFADQILRADEVGQSSEMFAEDVQGDLDIYSHIDGRDFATSYIFGTFAQSIKHPEVPSIIGRPVSYNVTSLVVQHTTVAANIVFDLKYSLLNLTIPLEVGAWFLLNNEGEIAQFDLSFKRWESVMEDIVPRMVERMNGQSVSANSDSTNATEVLQQYLATSICDASESLCAGRSSELEGRESCIDYMLSLPLGEYDQMGSNNLLCRSLQLHLLSANPEDHCEKISAHSSACIDQDPTHRVNWRDPWLAPKFITPENEHQVQHIFATNEEPLHPLLEFSLSPSLDHSWTPHFFASFTFGLLLMIWGSAKIAFALFGLFSPVFRDISIEHQRNVVMYAITIFWSTIALALQFPVIPLLMKDYGVYQLYCIRQAAIIISCLYIFELTFRFDMRLPLVAHHILTIAASALVVTMVEYTMSTTYIVSGCIWLFQATTEQPTFVGLLGYRMKWPPSLCAKLLKFASIQTLIFKCASAIALLAWWGAHQRVYYRPMDAIWTVFVWVICVGLLFTQFWGSWVTWKIGVRIGRKAVQSDVETATRSPTGSEEKKSTWGSAASSSSGLGTMVNSPAASQVDVSKADKFQDEGEKKLGLSPAVGSSFSDLIATINSPEAFQTDFSKSVGEKA